jgi:hypothetical protein
MKENKTKEEKWELMTTVSYWPTEIIKNRKKD